MLNEGEFDVLFTDVTLPGTSGVELARRALVERPRLGIIVASGHGASAVPHEDRELARAVVLPKPYNLTQMERALEAARPGSAS